MAVPSQSTVGTGQKIGAALWNDDVRDAISFLISPPRCSVYHSADVNVTAGTTWHLCAWDGEAVDAGGASAMHDTSTNNSRIYARDAGRYLVAASIDFATAAGTNRSTMVRKNSGGSSSGGSTLRVSTSLDEWGASSEGLGALVTFTVLLAAGDYIEVFGSHDSGSTRAIRHGDATFRRSYAEMLWVATT